MLFISFSYVASNIINAKRYSWKIKLES
jgi:hypothetical protein